MSASTSTPPTPIREGGPEYASRSAGTTRQLVTRLLVGCVLVAGPAACNDNDINVQPPATATPSSSASPAVDEQAALLTQYRKFWSSLAEVSALPAAERRGALEPLAVDPELKSILRSMETLDGKGQVLYGANVPRPSAKIGDDGITAVVTDCQDSSGAGSADRKTMRKLTIGVARNHVVTTMKKADGAWKLAFVAYPKTSC